MVHERFSHALALQYGAVKAQYPGEGRRRWRLRVLYESWSKIASEQPAANVGASDSSSPDPDPLDQLLEDEELGLIVRTDFTNDDAWKTFRVKVEASQKEFISDLTGNAEGNDASGDVAMQEHTSSSTPADEDESDSLTEFPDIVKILDPADATNRAKVTNISNLAALRLFNDVDIRSAPIPEQGIKRISPPNPLIDQEGWQEIYTGKHLWIYDSRSNTDECVRAVSQAGDFYSTATGDSWRTRASHVCELQFNMSNQGMKIDFGGLDRWDWEERARNLKESHVL